MAGGMRIKLKFEDPNVVKSNQILKGIAQCWFLVRSDFCSIGDVATDIITAFDLQDSCPHGISLLMENFALPMSQPATLLKENDLVSVRRDYEGKGEEVDCMAKLRLTEGGTKQEYIKKKSRSSDNRDIVPLIENDEGTMSPCINLGNHTTLSLKEAKGVHVKKKKKRARDDASNQVLLGANNEECGQLKGDERRTKRRKCSKDNDKTCLSNGEEGGTAENEDEQILSESEEAKVGKKQKKNRSSKAILRSYKDGNRGIEMEAPRKAETQAPEKTVTKAPEERETAIIVTDTDTSSTDGEEIEVIEAVQAHNYGAGTSSANGAQVKIMGEPEFYTTKTSSRSARRKKAKRQWLRQQALLQKDIGDCKQENNLAPSQLRRNVASEAILNSCSENGFLDRAVVVAPGHIRFETLSSDEESLPAHLAEENQHAIDFRHNFKSKKQGLSWGKEKKRCDNDLKYYNSKYEDGMSSAPREAPHFETRASGLVVDFENLPLLNGPPQKGDVIAYRVLELTSRMTPEVSCFRVGEIERFETSSQTVKVIPVNGGEMGSDDVMAGPSVDNAGLYADDGSLEVEFTQLMDVRVIKKTIVDTKLEGQPATVNGDSLLKENSSRLQIMQEIGVSADGPEMAFINSLGSDIISNVQSDERALAVEGVGNLDCWTKMIYTELDKKKLEISQRIGSERECSLNSATEEKKEHTVDAEKNCGTSVPAPKSKKSSRWFYRSLRSAALGPTVSRLRSEELW